MFMARAGHWGSKPREGGTFVAGGKTPQCVSQETYDEREKSFAGSLTGQVRQNGECGHVKEMEEATMKKNLGLLRCIAVVLLAAMLLTVSAFAADWPQFLGEEGAQGVSNGKSAITGADLNLRWERITSAEGTDSHDWTDVPGTPIVVGDYVYCYSSQYLRKIELATGKEVAKVKVYGEPVNQFFIDIAYAEGKIFMPCQKNNLDDTAVKGCFLRVYDAETLTQLYVTEQIPGGQMQSPVMYHDGYFVTGTYGKGGSYACFKASDDDTATGSEIKKAVWCIEAEENTRYGFSFNGAAFAGDYCYYTYGSDIFVVNYKTGEYQKYNVGDGYIGHSTVTWSKEMNRLYVAFNNPEGGASVFSFALGEKGMPIADTAREWKSGTKGGGTQSTPVVYKGRLYIGGGGGTMGSAEPFHVVDAATMQEIYSVPVLTKGSAGISTAYATEGTGQQVYIYIVPYAPKDESVSQLWIIKDKQGQTKADYEIVDGVGRRQYCSQSVIVAADGSLIWYNDAARLYCYENAANSSSPFQDTRGHWAESDILFLYNKGIVNGTGNRVFSPDDALTRAQFVQILAGASGADFTKMSTSAFDDVAGNAWFAPAVAWAVENGVTSGTGARRFSPNAMITRQDMAVMLRRYLENVAKSEPAKTVEAVSFADRGEISAYAADAVKFMQERGIISGIATENGLCFQPMANATRAQAATMTAKLYRLLGAEA